MNVQDLFSRSKLYQDKHLTPDPQTKNVLGDLGLHSVYDLKLQKKRQQNDLAAARSDIERKLSSDYDPLLSAKRSSRTETTKKKGKPQVKVATKSNDQKLCGFESTHLSVWMRGLPPIVPSVFQDQLQAVPETSRSTRNATDQNPKEQVIENKIEEQIPFYETQQQAIQSFAIVGSVGTVGSVPTVIRPQPKKFPKPPQVKRKKLAVETIQKAVIEKGTDSSPVNSVRGMEELLQEAEAIAKEPLAKFPTSSQPSISHDHTVPDKPAARTVNEIISSLHEEQRSQKVSESDRRIEELLNQVLGIEERPTSEQSSAHPDSRMETLAPDLSIPMSEFSLSRKDEGIEESPQVSQHELVEKSAEEVPVSSEVTLRRSIFSEAQIEDVLQQLTTEDALQIMSLPTNVTVEDLLGITGKKIQCQSISDLHQTEKDFVIHSSRKPSFDSHPESTKESFHFFCVPEETRELAWDVPKMASLKVPLEKLAEQWRITHVPDRFFKGEITAPGPVKRMSHVPSAMSRMSGAESQFSGMSSYYSSTTVARIPSPTPSDNRIEMAVNEIFKEIEIDVPHEEDSQILQIQGRPPPSYNNKFVPLFELAPAKLQAHPLAVQAALFPHRIGELELGDEYASHANSENDDDNWTETAPLSTEPRISEGVNDLEQEFQIIRDRILKRTYGSSDDVKKEAEIKRDEKPLTKTRPLFQRSNSIPNDLHWYEDDCLMIHMQYEEVVREIKTQKYLILKKEQLAKEESQKNEIVDQVKKPTVAFSMDQPSNEAVVASDDADVAAPSQDEDGEQIEDKGNDKHSRKPSPFAKKKHKPTPAELALEAGRNYVILPQRKKQKQKKKKRPISLTRLYSIERFLHMKPNNVEYRHSFNDLRIPVAMELRVPKKLRSQRRASLNLSPRDFDTWTSNNGFKGDKQPRDWITTVWDRWFDEVYPPFEDTPVDENPSLLPRMSIINISLSAPSAPAKEEDEGIMKVVEKHWKELDPQSMELIEENQVTYLPEKIDFVFHENEGPSKEHSEALLREEVETLSRLIDISEKPNAFYLCRRGAILRKLGYLTQSLTDLNEAISLEPGMINAYWHRHLLRLLQNKPYEALDDLNLLLKRDKRNHGAFKSRAEIYRALGDVTMAIVNYTYALKIDPGDYDATYKRAEMYDKKGETLLALEDFANASKLRPDRTDAVFKHGMHYFQSGQWLSAIHDFSAILRQEPGNSIALSLRGRALAKLKLWTPAVADLSAAIHYDPNNCEPYYHRGCILRQTFPKKALQDFSVSLMLNNTEDNVLCYLHRAILYCETGRPYESIADYEAVLERNQDIVTAHVNLGLVYFNMEMYEKALSYFNSAVTVEPTYVRGYVCRSEVLAKLNKYKEALLDINRAIHLKPTSLHFFLMRGEYLLHLKKLDLATQCVQHAAVMNEGFSTNATQQALVQTFLKNYDKAIESLTYEARMRPSYDNYMLVCKSQMKAKYWTNAITTLQKCLDIVRPQSLFQPWPPEAADANFLIGLCHMELKNYKDAVNSFNSALSIQAKHAQAYYQRGLSQLKLNKDAKALQDFNKSLSLNSDQYDVYLTRAAYYAMKNRHSKAILNCNEAIRIQPKCVRAFLYRGSLKYHIKAYGLADQDLTYTTNIDPFCSLAYFNRAVCAHESKQYLKALRDYGIVLFIDSKLKVKVLINRCVLYLEMRDYHNALLDLLEAIKLEPTNIYLWHTMGITNHKLHRLRESVKSYSEAINLDASFADAYIGRGNVLMDFGNEKALKAARRDYERVLIQYPSHLMARYNLALNLQMSGHFWRAWAQFTTIITQHAPHVGVAVAHEARGIVSLQMRNLDGAMQDLNEACHLQRSANNFCNRGVVHHYQGDLVNAMRDYRKALLTDPKHATTLYNQGIAYLFHRQLEQSLESFTQSLLPTPDGENRDEGAYTNRGLVRYLLGDREKALSDLKEAVNCSPYSAHIYYNRAQILMRSGKFHDAVNDLTKALELTPDDPILLQTRAECFGSLSKKEDALRDYKRALFIQSLLQKY